METIKKENDDFEWAEYTEKYYKPQVNQMKNEGIEFIIKNSYIENDQIIWKDNIHFLAKQLYGIIAELKPETVYECGCAGGHHLYNIKKLLPDTMVSGCDLLQSQIDVMSKEMSISQGIIDNIEVLDFSLPLPDNTKKYDFVFTNAVAMHLNTIKGEQFLKNISLISKKYIYFIENKSMQNFSKIFSDYFSDYEITEFEYSFLLKRKIIESIKSNNENYFDIPEKKIYKKRGRKKNEL